MGAFPIDVSPDAVSRIGAKAAVLERLLEVDPTLPIPPFITAEATESIDRIVQRVEQHPVLSCVDTVIVRSSSPDELSLATAGVYVSEILYNWREFIASTAVDVREQRALVSDEDTSAHHNSAPPIPFFVQLYTFPRYTGIVMKHPNVPEWLMASFRSESFTLGVILHGTVVFDYEGKVLKGLSYNGAGKRELKRVAGLYRRLEDLRLMDKEWSYQIELGLGSFNRRLRSSLRKSGLLPALYQVRPFSEVRTVTFDLPASGNGDRESLVIGITPEEGVELPVVRVPIKNFDDIVRGTASSNFGNMPYEAEALAEWRLQDRMTLSFEERMDELFSDGYCLLSDVFPGLGLNMFKNVRAVIAQEPSFNIGHDTSRFFGSVLSGSGLLVMVGNDGCFEKYSTGSRVRLYSNGRQGAIVPVSK